MCRFHLLVACYLALVVPLANAAEPQSNAGAIADVASGKLKEAKASWWGFNNEDATTCLQKAIDSKVPKLIVDNVGKSWIVTPLKLISDQEIVFEEGVEVLAKSGAFKGPTDSLFTGRLIENVTLSGHGATLRMRRADYADVSQYTRAEWRHALNLLSCRNVKVLGLTLTESGGDGIYLGAVKPDAPNRDVHINHVTCHRNHRQGISVISAENLTIENTTLSDTAGTAPQSGIDFEPNHPNDRIINCVVRHCIAANNSGYGFLAALGNLNAKSKPVSLRIEDCKARGNRGVSVAFITGNAPDAAVTGAFDVVDCELRDTGIEIINNPTSGCRILIKDCTLLSNDAGKARPVPILFTVAPTCVQDLGGAIIENVIVPESGAARPIQLRDQSGQDLRVVGITGTMTLQRSGKERQVELTENLLSQWIPQLAVKRIPRLKLDDLQLEPFALSVAGKTFDASAWRLRGTSTARVWARKGQRVTVMIKLDRIGNQVPAPVEVVVTSPTSQELMRQQIPFDKESPISFTAAETGAYQLTTTAGVNSAVFRSSTHPLCLEAGAGGLHLIASTGVLYFVVPKGTKEFGVRLHGEGTGEGVKAVLLNPTGRVVAERNDIVDQHQFTVEAPQAVGGIWSLNIAKPSRFVLEDYYVDLVGVAPLFAPTKAAALKQSTGSN